MSPGNIPSLVTHCPLHTSPPAPPAAMHDTGHRKYMSNLPRPLAFLVLVPSGCLLLSRFYIAFECFKQKEIHPWPLHQPATSFTFIPCSLRCTRSAHFVSAAEKTNLLQQIFMQPNAASEWHKEGLSRLAVFSEHRINSASSNI